MYGLTEALMHERCAELQRQAARHQLAEQVVAGRRWRRRAAAARRAAEGYEQRAEASARSEYELVGR